MKNINKYKFYDENDSEYKSLFDEANIGLIEGQDLIDWIEAVCDTSEGCYVSVNGKSVESESELADIKAALYKFYGVK